MNAANDAGPSGTSKQEGSLTAERGDLPRKETDLAEPLELAELPDAELVRRANTGSNASFGALVHRHWPRLLRIVQLTCGGCLFAEDLCQEACLEALNQLPHLREPESFGAWLDGFQANGIRHCRRKCEKIGTALPPESTKPIEAMSAVGDNHCAQDFETICGFMGRHVFADGDRIGSVAALMLAHYQRQEKFPTVRSVAAEMHCSRGTAHRLRCAALRAWRSDLTALGLAPESKWARK